MAEVAFVNNPNNTLLKFVSRPDYKRSPSLHVDLVAPLIKESQGKQRSDLEICMDLAHNGELVAHSTKALIEIFNNGGQGLPKHWVENQETMRKIVSMQATLDLGALNAIRIHGSDQGGIAGDIDGEISEMTTLLLTLQAKGGQGIEK